MVNPHEVFLQADSEGKRNQTGECLTEYIDKVAELSLVQEILLVLPPEENVARFVHVFTKDINPSLPKDPKVATLTALGGQFEKRLTQDLGIVTRVSYLNPSMKHKFEQVCQEKGFSLEAISLENEHLPS